MQSRWALEPDGVNHNDASKLVVVQMISIFIPVEALLARFQIDSVTSEREVNAKGGRADLIESSWVNKLAAMRRLGKSFSDVILRLVATEGPLATNWRPQ